MLRRVPPALLRAGQIALALALLALLWRVAGGEAALASLGSADPVWLAAGLLALWLQTGLSAIRWQVTAARLGIRLGTGEALREYFLGQVVNQSLPGGVLGDARRAVRARGQAGLLASSQAVIFERLAGQVGLFLCTALVFAVTVALPGGVSWPIWLALPVAGALGLGVATVVAIGIAQRRRGRPGRKLARMLQPLIHALAAREVIGRQAALSLATTLCNLVAFGCAAKAVGHGIPPAAVAAYAPLILLTMLVPLTISGWGLREAAAAALFPLAGASASGGLAASIGFGLLMIVSALPGLAVLLVRRSPPLAAR